MKFIEPPYRNFIIIVTIFIGFLSYYLSTGLDVLIFVGSFLGSIQIFIKAIKDVLFERKITIDVFNAFVLVIAFYTENPGTAGFIVLMLTFADYLDWKTESRAHHAIEELLKLNPLTALVERGERIEEIKIDEIKEGDIIVVENGARVPVDGIIVFGRALINESSVSGESVPIEKVSGDKVFSSTLNESGIVKIRATGVGKNSTIERMVELIKGASLHKSRAEKLADRFAEFFLPTLLIIGGLIYFYTSNLNMVISLFLVACADDMAVAIPLAMTASLGRAARRGVVIKGGEWFEALANMDTLIFDKTGTLTYGSLKLESVHIENGIKEDDFWKSVAIAEKFSEHPVGHAMFREATKTISRVPDPEEFKVFKGSGVYAKHNKTEILIGNEKLFSEFGIEFDEKSRSLLHREREEHRNTTSLVYINKKLAGVITIADVIHSEAKKSIESIKKLGVKNVVMFTGDNNEVAREVSTTLGITEFRARMTPETKLLELEKLNHNKIVGMVGDGINDAPSLARANVGMAMGEGGTAVAIEAADVVILSNNLNRIPEIIKLGRKTISVIRWDMAIWFVSNMVGFTLVITGYIDPMLAALYNFLTDFFPLINSARLFREKI